MRYILLILAALTLVSTPPPAPDPEALSQITPFYRRKRWEDLIECPGSSKLSLHGECWRKVDVEVEKCSELPAVSEDDTETRDQSMCPRQKRIFRFGFV